MSDSETEDMPRRNKGKELPAPNPDDIDIGDISEHSSDEIDSEIDEQASPLLKEIKKKEKRKKRKLEKIK